MAVDYGPKPSGAVGVVSVAGTQLYSVSANRYKSAGTGTVRAWVGVAKQYSPVGNAKAKGTLRKIYSGPHMGKYIHATVKLQPTPKPPVISPTATIFDFTPRFQFGQVGAPWWLQASGCNDVSAQMIIEWYKNDLVPLTDIRLASGGPQGRIIGLTPNQVLAALSHYGINFYQKAYGVDATFVREKSKIGPVLVVVEYGTYPNLIGTCSSNSSRIAIKGGRNDCGFSGTHALLCIGGAATGTNTYMRDPDHGSPSRPFKPAYDTITTAQLNSAMRAVPGHQGWTNTYCLYPTKKKGA